MPDLRFNIVTGKWAIVADKSDKRLKRPEDFFPRNIKTFNKRKEECPFCLARDPKKEFAPVWVPKGESAKQIPTFIIGFRRREERRDSIGDFMGDWTVCVKHNVYPFLDLIPSQAELKTVPGESKEGRVAITWVNGMGICDVVIETDSHNEPIGLMSSECCEDIIDVYLNRFQECSKDRRIRHIAIFGNHGVEAGASLEHPHSQIVATAGMVPAEIQREFDHASKEHLRLAACCPMCRMLRDELREQERIVKDDKDFVVLEPYASEYPFETWIVPREHRSSFGEISKEEKRSFARVLTWACGRIRVALDDTSYNYVLKTALPEDYDKRDSYHWYMKIEPRGLTTTGGFEEGTGLMVNTVAPEIASEWLKKRGNALTLDKGSLLQRSREERLKAIHVIEDDGDSITDEEKEIIKIARKLP